MYHHEPRQAFRQFQYPTLPLGVSTDYKNRVLRAALDRALQRDPQHPTERSPR